MYLTFLTVLSIEIPKSVYSQWGDGGQRQRHVGTAAQVTVKVEEDDEAPIGKGMPCSNTSTVLRPLTCLFAQAR